MNYTPIMIWMTLSIMLIMLLTIVSLMFMKEEYSVNCNIQFECGMESMHPNSTPMYMHFYMVAILFLIFDMEFVISLPLINIMCMVYRYPFWWLFVTTLALGLIIEVMYGSTNWKE